LFNDWKANNIDVEENNSDAYRKIKKDFGALSNVYIYNVDSQTVDRHKNVSDRTIFIRYLIISILRYIMYQYFFYIFSNFRQS
jgi:hypothetical protein